MVLQCVHYHPILQMRRMENSDLHRHHRYSVMELECKPRLGGWEPTLRDRISQSLSHWSPASKLLKVFYGSNSRASSQPDILDSVQVGLETCLLLSSWVRLMCKWRQNQDQYFAGSGWTSLLIRSLASLILYVPDRRTRVLWKCVHRKAGWSQGGKGCVWSNILNKTSQ